MTDREYMQVAVEMARRSRGEEDRVHPMVGAVAARGVAHLGSASRGEDDKKGEHAEYRLLEVHLKGEVLSESTIFTTLEPCYRRSEGKKSCALRLIRRRIRKVFIGMLDPDPSVHGKGQMSLLEHGIEVGNFEPDLTQQILEMNRDFIDDRTTPDITFDDLLHGQEFQRGKIPVGGKHRAGSSSVERLALFTRRGSLHWPQDGFVANQDGPWECTINETHPGETTLIAASVDPNCALWIAHYLKVTRTLTDPKRWVGLEIERLPDGIRVHQQIKIKVV